MWRYEKRLQYPVEIKHPDPKLAKMIISQLGGPDGEMGASMRYLNQRYAMPYPNVAALLTDIGTEECVHRGLKLKTAPAKGAEITLNYILKVLIHVVVRYPVLALKAAKSSLHQYIVMIHYQKLH